MIYDDDEAAIVALANENGKFAVQVGYPLTLRETEALERLQLSDRVRLIDVSTIAASPGLFRVFRVMP